QRHEILIEKDNDKTRKLQRDNIKADKEPIIYRRSAAKLYMKNQQLLLV
ncbi:MAG: hypothetical protein ACJATY_003150, partial [Spirosomataceae bacterium]